MCNPALGMTRIAGRCPLNVGGDGVIGCQLNIVMSHSSFCCSRWLCSSVQM